MCARLAIIYNEPAASRYRAQGEEAAEVGVLKAVEAVHHALLALGYDVVLVPLALPLETVSKKLIQLKVNLAFNLFEGFGGYPETEAEVADILSALGVPYTGSTGTALRLALDKAATKTILRTAGISTPDFQVLTPETLSTFRLNYPCIVKPRGEDASHGITESSVVSDFASLKEQVAHISYGYGGQALVEEFIDGREFNLTVLGNSAGIVLPPSEISYSLPPGMPRLLTFAAKWQPESQYFQGTTVTCPADIDREEQRYLAETALAAFRRLGCRGYARVDMRLNERSQLYVIEVNPNPDLSPDAGTVRQAAAAGMTYPQFIARIVQLALEKEGEKHQDSTHGQSRQTGLDENTAAYARIQTV